MEQGNGNVDKANPSDEKANRRCGSRKKFSRFVNVNSYLPSDSLLRQSTNS